MRLASRAGGPAVPGAEAGRSRPERAAARRSSRPVPYGVEDGPHAGSFHVMRGRKAPDRTLDNIGKRGTACGELVWTWRSLAPCRRDRRDRLAAVTSRSPTAGVGQVQWSVRADRISSPKPRAPLAVRPALRRDPRGSAGGSLETLRPRLSHGFALRSVDDALLASKRGLKRVVYHEGLYCGARTYVDLAPSVT
jgi:hypothetical protein